MATPTTIDVSKIYILDTEPSNKIANRFWFDTSTNILKRYNKSSDAWESTSLHADNVEISTSGSSETVNLTTYLANNIAALAEGIDTKADADSTNTSIQSLKIDKLNRGYLTFGEDGVDIRGMATTTLTQSFTPSNLTFCFSVEKVLSALGVMNLTGLTSSTNTVVGVGCYATSTYLKISISNYYGIGSKSYGFNFNRSLTIDDSFVLTVSIDFDAGDADVNCYCNGDGLELSSTSEFFENAAGGVAGVFPPAFTATKANLAQHNANYCSNPGTGVRYYRRMKIFNFILPLNDDADTDGVGYTIEDYFNGLDESPLLQDSTADKQAIVSLVDFFQTVGSTKKIANAGTGGNFSFSGSGPAYGTYDNQVKEILELETTNIKDSLTKSDVGLNNVDNTSDVDKPISTATQTALDSLTKSDVGLNNVNNTSDANKPISTATQTALDSKVDTTTLGNYSTTADVNSAIDTAISNKADLATTLSGYGITDAYNKTETLDLLDTNTPPYLEYVTDAFTLSPTSTTAGIQVSSEMKSGTIHIYPSISNSNACYLIRSSSAKPDVLIPYYPDQHSTISVTNLSQWYLWCNNVGDSAILQLEVNNKETDTYSEYTVDNPLCMVVDTSTNITSTLVAMNGIVTWDYTVMSDLALSTAKTALLLQDATGRHYVQASIVEIADNIYTWKLELRTGDITNTSGIVETLYFTNSDGETYTARIEVINNIPTWKLEIV